MPQKMAKQTAREQLSEIYDDLYARASAIVAKYNPCKITKGKCHAGRCVKDGLCCGGCRFLGENGCTTQSLICKVWLCFVGVRGYGRDERTDSVVNLYFDEMQPIIKEMKHYALDSPRCDKEYAIESVLRSGQSVPWGHINYKNDKYYPLPIYTNAYNKASKKRYFQRTGIDLGNVTQEVIQ